MFKAPYGLNFKTILDFFSVPTKKKNKKKTGRCLKVISAFWDALCLGRALVAVVERFKLTRVNVWTFRRDKTKKINVTVVERWSLMEVPP